MRKLGISIYPEKSDINELKKYIQKAYDCGFRRIFSSFLFAEDNIEEVKNKFKEVNSFAHELGYEIIVDVNPRVMKALGINYDDLRFFKSLYADGIRLDLGFSGLEESMMTFNEEGLKIEINMSMDTHMIDNIMDYMPNKYNLIGCHNFYPHRYSALDIDFFMKTTEKFNAYKLRTAAFVTSQNKETFGPWPVSEGLPTLEIHRDLPLDVQIKHFILMDNIDDIIISNCYASDEELEKISELSLDKVSFDVDLVDGITDLMRKIVLEEKHFYRGDHSDYLIRSTQSRVKYKGESFPIVNTPEKIRKGDVIIEADGYGHYTGELQIAKKDMENSGLSNVVGRISEDEIFLIDYLKPWQKFAFKLKWLWQQPNQIL